MSDLAGIPIPQRDPHSLLAKAGATLRTHLSQEERERLARLISAAVWHKDEKPELSATAILQLLQRYLGE
jgi:hypothetical protein